MSVHIDSDGGVCLSVCRVLKQKEERDGDRERQRETEKEILGWERTVYLLYGMSKCCCGLKGNPF